MLTREKLARINERPRKVRLVPLLGIGAAAVALAALLAVFFPSPLLALPALLAGIAGVWAAYRSQTARRTVSLTYNFDLNRDIDLARFAAVQKACEILASSERVWRITGSPDQRNTNSHDQIQPPLEREPVRVGLIEAPGISANVPIWEIEAAGQKVLFFPEVVLLYREERYEPVPYRSLEVRCSPERFLEEEVPEDAEVVGQRWRYITPDGSPDHRYKDNLQMPVVLYGLLQISGSSDLDVRLQVSDRGAAFRFAEAFEAVGTREQEAAREKRHRRADEAYLYWAEQAAKADEARKTLGVATGASMSEITAAYKEMARTYHPDKAVKLSAEDRELAEQRMKEINAAYSELKLQRRKRPSR